MSNDTPRLPIKVVGTDKRDYREPATTGGSTTILCDVTPALRRSLARSLDAVEKAFAHDFAHDPSVPAVARVTLRKKALAKSHRPVSLFSEQSCPIIGAEGLGELLISVHPRGLQALKKRIAQANSKKARAALSTVESIEPYKLRWPEPGGQAALKKAVTGRAIDRIKLSLFIHGDPVKDGAIWSALHKLVGQEAVDTLPYGREGLFRVTNVTASTITKLSAFVGTQSIDEFPVYFPVQLAAHPVRDAQPSDVPSPQPGTNYPIVGIIDTGVDPANPLLAPWIHARENYVPAGLENYEHGTFVAGLLVHGRTLNADPTFPLASCRIVDVAAIPSNKSLREDALLVLLEQVVKKYVGVVRIWNLSLATPQKCCDAQITDFGAALDRLQDAYGVSFVIAAGNVSIPPLRPWPNTLSLGEHDRIVAPADSTRGITVGSIAHIARPTALSPIGMPSPFSRRGPGPAFLPKPEVSHIGGNCDASLNYRQMGVCSLGENGSIVENVGTSFATPLVTSIVASIDAELKDRPSSNLLKALTVHSAALRARSLDAATLRYAGFGTPGEVSDILTCTQGAATLIFEVPLLTGYEFEKLEFPIPTCLRAGDEVRGEFLMTLVYDPPLDGNHGAEYCRTNVDASLGTYEPGSDQRQHTKRIPEEPRDIGQLYEKHLVEHGFKWSPVKVYRRLMSRGVTGRHWRLLLTVHHRAGYASSHAQSAALVVTIRDPAGGPVYDGVVQAMRQSGWVTQDLAIRGRMRLQN